jgi:glycosyltransferase involved in cell wall biosynthesis
MSKPRLSFILQDALGWRTYRARLEAVLASRDDVEAQLIPVTMTRRDTLFHKRNNMRSRDHLFRRIDPIDAFAGRTGRAIRAGLTEFRSEAVHFAAHWPAAALAGQAGAMPFTVTLDNTRAGIERDLPRGAWTAADMAREAALLQAAAHVFPMSHWTARSVISDCGVAPEAVTVMPPSIDVAQFVPARLAGREGKLRVIFIGNDIARKGAVDLANWIAGPLAELAELHIVSGDPAARALSDKATVHGRVPNARLVTELLPEMDVLCLPTRSDMSPQVLAEAAAAGLPAVASRIGGIPDMILEGETGFTVPAGDAAGFVAALAGLAQNRMLAAKIGTSARAHAVEAFDAARNFNQLIDRLVAIARPKGTTEI